MTPTPADQLRPCPFCGTAAPEFPFDIPGTQYEVQCLDCCQSMVSIQICDLMTIDERETGWINAESRYRTEFVLRARRGAIEAWNRRTPPEAEAWRGIEYAEIGWITADGFSALIGSHPLPAGSKLYATKSDIERGNP